MMVYQEEIRELVKRMVMNSGGGHVGGSLSMSEILASLYGDVMRYDVKNPEWEERDRFILSKGHSALGFYAALHLAGFFEEELLYTFGVRDGILMNHPERSAVSGVEVSTGSLGHGLPIAVGMALAAQRKGEGHFVYCLMGDAEIHEGSVWEAAIAASGYKLKRLVAIIDRNHIGNDGLVDTMIHPETLVAKWESFGFCTSVVDGHSREQLTEVLSTLKTQADGPYAVIAETVKGKGLVPGIAGTGKSHYLKGNPEEISAKFLH